MALSASNLFLANAVIEGVLPSLAALGKVSAVADKKAADPDVLFALSALGFCAIPSALFWKDGQLSGHRSFGIGNCFYHVAAGAKIMYDRMTRPKADDSTVLTVVGAIHLYMGYSFYKYVTAN